MIIIKEKGRWCSLSDILGNLGVRESVSLSALRPSGGDNLLS